MKILSRILVALLVLLGIAFLVLETRAAAAKECEATDQIRLGLDDNGCETKQPLEVTEKQMDAWLKAAGIPKECYKIRTYDTHNPKPYRGELALVACTTKESAQSPKPKTFQPTGTGQTQRIMFNTSKAKEDFEKQIQAAKK